MKKHSFKLAEGFTVLKKKRLSCNSAFELKQTAAWSAIRGAWAALPGWILDGTLDFRWDVATSQAVWLHLPSAFPAWLRRAMCAVLGLLCVSAEELRGSRGVQLHSSLSACGTTGSEVPAHRGKTVQCPERPYILSALMDSTRIHRGPLNTTHLSVGLILKSILM